MTVNGTTTKYVVNPEAVLSQVLMETDASGKPTAWYVYGNGLIGRQDANGAYQSYHYDRRGSTIALTDAKGQLTDTCSYGTYGESLGHEGTIEQPFQYNGRDGVMTDPNGLYQMRARYYNPEIKRFVNRDVLSGSIDDGLTINRYAYVNGNPISYIDPFGLSADSDEMFKTVGSFLADAVPIVGAVKGVQEVFTGTDYVTGQQLSVGDRVATGVGTLVSFVLGGKVVGKTATKGAIDGGSWLFGKLSKQVRLAKPSDLFKNDFAKMVREFLLKICIVNLKNLRSA
ncbi:pre-toxin TG domain-containing protein [Paenibacillus kyungheensis]|uniref:Pre-toxin TG domain-containing protein n=1 Tax=Paenibacillus kyungheensis TaxID=1452732 RepID=A0AAX3M3W7_9BACL|nr:RHS repeat-associated core domain-containing protein [Paenibacillus kyungheensis]WCT56588.1 pre-toxin TG domain-containing protein [Paenibacillus kyungheensis]